MLYKKIGRTAVILFVIAVLYLVVGACAPFLITKTVENASQADELVKKVQTDRESPDRSGIIESNQAALEERIRLIHMAKENIVLATFDMREGESTSDLLAMLYEKAERTGLKSGFLWMGSAVF